jgi:hypothetical protein
MAKARFSGFVKKIDVADDCKMTLTIFDPDQVLSDLIPMRATRVWVDLETAQPNVDDVYEQNQRDARAGDGADGPEQLTLQFDGTGFQVPTVDGGSGSDPQPSEPGEVVPMAPALVVVGYKCTQCGREVKELAGDCECGCSMFDELTVTPEEQHECCCEPGNPCKLHGADLPVDQADAGEAVQQVDPLCPECQGAWGNKCPICGGEGVLKAPPDHNADHQVGDV